jgi:hypothetical protein
MLVVEKEKVIMDYFKFDGAEIEVVSAVNRYGTLPIRYYDDLNLSPKAWGILGKIFLLKSRNENWKISVNGLATQIKGGRDLVKSTVKELKDNGYLHIMQGRNENGSFGTTKWYIFESPDDNPFFLKADDMPESENPTTVENTVGGKSTHGEKTPQAENPHTGKSATAGGKSAHGQNPLNKPQAEKPHTENPPQTKIERKIERYKKENLSKEKENRSASSVIGKIQSQIGFEFLLKEHPEDEQLLKLISRVIAEKLLSEDASITSKNFSYSSDEVHECFETLDFNHIEYLLECLKKNPKKEIRNMKQYLLVTLMNVQANYEGAKLNKNKSDEEELAEEKQEEENTPVADDMLTSTVSEILGHQGKQVEMNHNDSDELDDIFNQSISKDEYMKLFGDGSSNSAVELSRSAFWDLYKKPDDSRSIADLNNGELAEITFLMQNQDLVEKLKAKA